MAERLSSLAKIVNHTSRLSTIRSKNSLDAVELKNLLFLEGKYEGYIQKLFDFFDQNKQIFTHHNLEGHSRQKMREQAAKMVLATLKFAKIDIQKHPMHAVYVLWALSFFDVGLSIKSILHYTLYTKTIILFQNHPKHKEWIDDAMALRDLGCFGLTEFHHGSYSKEIKTLAIYNREAKQFELTTQGTKGMKYWIGASAQMANMSIIWAQLIVDGKSKGPHPFVVPIRCKKTHKTLPGITIGDCGPKNGVNYIDNGYIILEGVRVPSYSLLGKIGGIDENGNYKTSIEESDTRFGFHMNPLSSGRGAIAFTANASALKAVTIALRYACNRRQFDNSKKTGEVLIIDYPITKNRLIPFVAQTFVQIHPTLLLARAYFEDPNIFTDLKYVGQLHAVSAAVKARVSWNATTVAQDTRSVLGGHGYSALSNISNIFHDLDINNTWEGDNSMLLQQTSKYLMKTISSQAKTKIVDLSFIWKPKPVDEERIQANLRSLEVLELLFKDLFRIKYSNAKETF